MDFFANIPAWFTSGPADYPAATSASTGLVGLFGISTIVLALLILGVFYLCYRKFGQKEIPSDWLKHGFFVAWVLAFAVYDTGMFTGHYLSLLTNAPMAVIHALETFLLGNDIGAIHEPFHNNLWFMLAFSLSHALSAVISTLFIIKIVGFNLVQKIRLYVESKRGAKVPETYVFWGVNNATYTLARSIKEHYGNATNAYRIVIVKTSPADDEASDNKIGIDRIFEFLSLNNRELRQLNELNCLITKAPNLDNDDTTGSNSDIIGETLRMKSLARILSEKTTKKIRLFFLSDDENQNLHDVSRLLQDSTLQAFAQQSVKPKRMVKFYCHARYNGVHRVIEDQYCTNNLQVEIIDSSHLNVELLKGNKTVLPVNFVEVEADATVSTPFNAMVIGFSEVGRDASKFIYEFGAFVKSGGDDDHAVRSDFRLDIIDRDMKNKAGAFLANAPAINPSLPFIPGRENPDALIALHNIDCCSVEFTEMLRTKITTLNYVVIATDNDELNMTMGIRIFRAATRYRSNLDRLCILIRIHNDDDGHFARIAQYYNRLWAAQNPHDCKGNDRSTRCLKTADCPLPLHIFGRDNDIYTFSNIINDPIQREAANFKERYTEATETDYVPKTEDSEKKWHKEIEDLLQVEGDYHTSYARLMKLRRTQHQDCANSFHKLTKCLLAKKALERANPTERDPRNPRLLTVLAQTEHLRWNASHQILGYVYDPAGKNEIRLLHNCITDWENLDQQTRSYDYNVVDLSLTTLNPTQQNNQPE